MNRAGHRSAVRLARHCEGRRREHTDAVRHPKGTQGCRQAAQTFGLAQRRLEPIRHEHRGRCGARQVRHHVRRRGGEAPETPLEE